MVSLVTTAALQAQWINTLSRSFARLSPAAVFVPVTVAICLFFFLYYWHCLTPRPHSLEWIAMSEEKRLRPPMTLTMKRNPMTRRDIFPMLLITAVYAATAFFHLGSFAAPQTCAVFDYDTEIVFSYEAPVTVDKLSFYTNLGTGSYSLEYRANGVWSEVELEQPFNSLFKWCIVDLNEAEEGELPHGPITAHQFRITAKNIDRQEGLYLAELALWDNGTPLVPSAVSSGGRFLFDETELWTQKYTFINSSYFDEVYHPRTALEHLENVYPYEISHPPLGKLIISLGIWLFGMTPFGWRFMGTLFGVLMLPILYVFLKNLFGKTPVAFCGTCLFAFDFMHLVQTRLATIDTYGVFFILVSYYFMYRWLSVPAGSRLRRSVFPLFLSGLFWGIGCACKWTVVYAGAGLALLWLLGLIFKGREWNSATGADDRPRFAPYVVGTFFLSILFFVVVPVCIYTVSYLPYVMADAANGGAAPTFLQLINQVWDNQVFMFTYHQGAQEAHPYSSHWYQWILNGRPILYYRDLSYVSTHGVKSLFGAFNNPMVSWGGLLAFIAVVVQTVRRKCGVALFIVIATLSQFVPWLGIGRTLFAYHYFPTILFLVFAISYLMNDMLRRRRSRYTLAVYGFTGFATALYALFYPMLIGLYIPTWYSEYFLRWLPSWPF